MVCQISGFIPTYSTFFLRVILLIGKMLVPLGGTLAVEAPQGAL